MQSNLLQKSFTTIALVKFRLKFFGTKDLNEMKRNEWKVFVLFCCAQRKLVRNGFASLERDFDMSRVSANRKQFRKRFRIDSY